MPAPTIIETLTQLGQDLRDVIASCLGLRSEMQEIKDSTVLSTSTIINNFQNRAPIQGAFIHEANGIDAPGRGSEQAPYKTIDYALDVMDQSVTRILYLLSDCTMRRWHQVFGKVRLVGFALIPSGPFGYPYSYVPRKLSFLAEATNSPRTDIGRCMPLFDCASGTIDLITIDLVIPASAPGINYNCLIAPNGGDFFFSGVNLTVENPGTLTKLFLQNSYKTSFSFSGSIGANVPGKIFSDIAAGANPNASFYWDTNLTSA